MSDRLYPTVREEEEYRRLRDKLALGATPKVSKSVRKVYPAVVYYCANSCGTVLKKPNLFVVLEDSVALRFCGYRCIGAWASALVEKEGEHHG